jgi:hypothetical protein
MYGGRHLFPSVDFLGMRVMSSCNAFLWFFMERWVHVFVMTCMRLVHLLLHVSWLRDLRLMCLFYHFKTFTSGYCIDFISVKFLFSSMKTNIYIDIASINKHSFQRIQWNPPARNMIIIDDDELELCFIEVRLLMSAVFSKLRKRVPLRVYMPVPGAQQTIPVLYKANNHACRMVTFSPFMPC